MVFNFYKFCSITNTSQLKLYTVIKQKVPKAGGVSHPQSPMNKPLQRWNGNHNSLLENYKRL